MGTEPLHAAPHRSTPRHFFSTTPLLPLHFLPLNSFNFYVILKEVYPSTPLHAPPHSLHMPSTSPSTYPSTYPFTYPST